MSPKIFGIGLSRTGTTSCCELMKTLGYKSIHLPLNMQQINEHEFCNDASVAARFEQLDKDYPGSKFIYTTRDRTAWVASCMKWLDPQSRNTWFQELPSDRARQWISDCDFSLFGYHYQAMSGIGRDELLEAYDRHEKRIMLHFQARYEDLIVIDLTAPDSMPVTQLVQFLEKNALLAPPKLNTARPDLARKKAVPDPETKLQRETDSQGLAEEQRCLAWAWASRGKTDHARQKYAKALWLMPDHIAAIHELGRLLIGQDPPAAIQHFREGLNAHPNEAILHKGLADACDAQSEPGEAFEIYQLERKDNREINHGAGALLCCLVVRNGATRLPFFLAYYRALGIDRFFVIDNDSEDSTATYLLQQDDVHLWHSTLSFNRANFGSAWFELLLRNHGRHHWCLIVDIDELFYFPEVENRNLRQLCDALDGKGKRAFEAVLVDMYSDQSIDKTDYHEGDDYRAVCPFFDRKFYSHKIENAGPYGNQTVYFGGVRDRMFGPEGRYLLSKVPLIKYESDTVLSGGQHWTNCTVDEVADESGCLLHFKFMSTFRHYVGNEVERKEHFGGGMQYREYARTLESGSALMMYDPNHSLRLQESRQLIDLGIMSVDHGAMQVSPDDASAVFPEVVPLGPDVNRPFWSVMITVYNRVAYLERALVSVLEQAPGRQQMQIEVVSDSVDEAMRSEIAAIVDEVGGSRITLYQPRTHLGHPEIFNECIRRASGRWVHILHDDDWILPGFYEAMERGIASDPEPGAAFCRGVHVSSIDLKPWTSWLERDTPGIVPNWIERVALDCRLQFSSVVVKRQAYERVGGFYAGAESTFDWDMWKRICH